MTDIHVKAVIMSWPGMECISSYHMNGPHVMEGSIIKYRPDTACSEENSPVSNGVRILSFANFNNLEGGVSFNCQHFYSHEICKIKLLLCAEYATNYGNIR